MLADLGSVSDFGLGNLEHFARPRSASRILSLPTVSDNGLVSGFVRNPFRVAERNAFQREASQAPLSGGWYLPTGPGR